MALINFGGQKGVVYKRGVVHKQIRCRVKRRGFNDTESHTEKFQVLPSMESLLLLHSIRRVFPRLVVEKETVVTPRLVSPNVREWD